MTLCVVCVYMHNMCLFHMQLDTATTNDEIDSQGRIQGGALGAVAPPLSLENVGVSMGI